MLFQKTELYNRRCENHERYKGYRVLKGFERYQRTFFVIRDVQKRGFLLFLFLFVIRGTL
jgi:hypothetical protein